MKTSCPQCRAALRLADDPRTPHRCPYCLHVFLPDRCRGLAKVFLALDVSASMQPWLPDVHLNLLNRLWRARKAGPYEVCTYLFHREVLPFPSERQCRPTAFDVADLPTLRDLRHRSNTGTAVVDALYHLLEDATSQAPLPCDLIVLTDGHEHSSRRHPDELRRKIASSAAGVNIAVLLVGDTAGPAQATELAPKLGLAATAGWPRELRFGLLNRSPHKLRLCPFLTASVTLE